VLCTEKEALKKRSSGEWPGPVFSPERRGWEKKKKTSQPFELRIMEKRHTSHFSRKRESPPGGDVPISPFGRGNQLSGLANAGVYLGLEET